MHSNMSEPEGIYLAAPFASKSRIVQQWGENSARYQQIRIAGVALRGHNGIDFAFSAVTPVLAVDDGYVMELDHSEGYGFHLRLVHWWGESLYAHLQEFAVASGTQVTRAQMIGHCGRKGQAQPGHLHLGIRIDPFARSDGWGGYTNPLPFLDPKLLRSADLITNV